LHDLFRRPLPDPVLDDLVQLVDVFDPDGNRIQLTEEIG